jgi:chorismate synthase
MMSANRFGQAFSITTFGESHGVALGVVVDGCPAGVDFDLEILNRWTLRRRPGGALVSARAESDQAELLSGVHLGKTLGTPIALIVRNHDARSQDYADLKVRAGHADDVWLKKFGHSDVRGGGRASGRETVSRVLGAAVAEMFLKTEVAGLKIESFTESVGPIKMAQTDIKRIFSGEVSSSAVDSLPARFGDANRAKEVEDLLQSAKRDGHSYGGTACVIVRNAGAGLGQPVFRKLKSDIAQAMMSVGAATAVEIGDGFSAAQSEGSEFHTLARENPYGGVRGGISTGEDIFVRAAFKPTSSVLDLAKKGRHDPCIVPRASIVLEAMMMLLIADHALLRRLDRV